MAGKDDIVLLDPSLESADIMTVKVPLTNGNEKYRQFFHSASELSKKSDGFRAILNSPDSKERTEGNIWIRDFLPRTVQQFLNFLNGKELFVSSTEDMIDLMRMADKYLVQDLNEKTQEILATRFDSTNVLTMYQAIHLHQVPALKKECEDFISIYFSAFAISYDFLHLDEEAAKSILSLDTLNVKTEMEVYKAAYRWSRERCVENRYCICESHLLQVGKQLFSCVRYGNLTEEEKKNVFASALLEDTNNDVSKRLQIDDSSLFFKFLDKVPYLAMTLHLSPKEPEWTTFNRYESCVCLTLIPMTESVHLMGFRGEFINPQNSSWRTPIMIHICSNGANVCSCGNIHRETKPTCIYYCLKKPLELKIGCIYTIKAEVQEERQVPVYHMKCGEEWEPDYINVGETATHISKIYYIPLIHANKK